MTGTKSCASSTQDFDDRHLVSEVRRVTLVGLVVNVALSALKFAAGILGNSRRRGIGGGQVLVEAAGRVSSPRP